MLAWHILYYHGSRVNQLNVDSIALVLSVIVFTTLMLLLCLFNRYTALTHFSIPVTSTLPYPLPAYVSH